MVAAQPKRKQITSPIILIGLLIALTFAGEDMARDALQPLKDLRIAFPSILSYTVLFASGIATFTFIAFRRRFPLRSEITAFLLAFALWWLMLGGLAWYAERPIVRISITRWLTDQEAKALASCLTCPIMQQGSSGRGDEILIERDDHRAGQLTEELRKLQILRSPGRLP